MLHDLLIGYFTSIVPTNILASSYSKNANYDGFDFIQVLQITPIFFAITNVIIMSAIDATFSAYSLNVNYRFIVAGLLIALIYSSIGRFYLEIPQKVLKMQDPIYFQIYAIAVWIFVYFIVYLMRDRLECQR